MGKRLIAILIGSTMTLTTLAMTPARAASDDDIGRLIAGAITLFVIGKAVEDFTAPKKKKAPVTKNKSIANQYYDTRPNQSTKANRRTLPRECFFRMKLGRERIGVFGATCLNEFVRRPGRLPRECAMTVPVRHGRKAKVYEAECLRDYGYRSAYLEDR